MGRLLLGIVIGQILLYMIQRIFEKNVLFRMMVARLFLALWSWIGLEMWMMYRGFGDFFSFQLFPFLACLIPPWVLHLISLRVGGVQVNAESMFPVSSFRLKGEHKRLFVQESLYSAYMAVYEELLVRWFLISALFELTQNVELSVSLPTLMFCLMQLNRHPTAEQILDALLFTAALTLVYLWSSQPIFCILLHVLRSQLRISQAYIARKTERESQNKCK